MSLQHTLGVAQRLLAGPRGPTAALDFLLAREDTYGNEPSYHSAVGYLYRMVGKEDEAHVAFGKARECSVEKAGRVESDRERSIRKSSERLRARSRESNGQERGTVKGNGRTLQRREDSHQVSTDYRVERREVRSEVLQRGSRRRELLSLLDSLKRKAERLIHGPRRQSKEGLRGAQDDELGFSDENPQELAREANSLGDPGRSISSLMGRMRSLRLVGDNIVSSISEDEKARSADHAEKKERSNLGCNRIGLRLERDEDDEDDGDDRDDIRKYRKGYDRDATNTVRPNMSSSRSNNTHVSVLESCEGYEDTKRNHLANAPSPAHVGRAAQDSVQGNGTANSIRGHSERSTNERRYAGDLIMQSYKSRNESNSSFAHLACNSNESLSESEEWGCSGPSCPGDAPLNYSASILTDDVNSGPSTSKDKQNEKSDSWTHVRRCILPNDKESGTSDAVANTRRWILHSEGADDDHGLNESVSRVSRKQWNDKIERRQRSGRRTAEAARDFSVLSVSPSGSECSLSDITSMSLQDIFASDSESDDTSDCRVSDGDGLCWRNTNDNDLLGDFDISEDDSEDGVSSVKLPALCSLSSSESDDEVLSPCCEPNPADHDGSDRASDSVHHNHAIVDVCPGLPFLVSPDDLDSEVETGFHHFRGGSEPAMRGRGLNEQREPMRRSGSAPNIALDTSDSESGDSQPGIDNLPAIIDANSDDDSEDVVTPGTFSRIAFPDQHSYQDVFANEETLAVLRLIRGAGFSDDEYDSDDHEIGLHPGFVDRMAPKVILRQGDLKVSESCAICHEALGTALVRSLPCSEKHCYHAACIDRWLESHVTCPNCRSDLRMKQTCNQKTCPIVEAVHSGDI